MKKPTREEIAAKWLNKAIDLGAIPAFHPDREGWVAWVSKKLLRELDAAPKKKARRK